MGLNISTDPNQLKKILFNGAGSNPLYPSTDAAAPAPPTSPPAAGAIASAMPPDQTQPAAPTTPFNNSTQAADQRPPDVAGPSSTPNAPISQAPQPYHHGTLAKVFLGIGEALGNPLATRIGERDRAREQEVAEYNRNVPSMQYAANQGARKTEAELQKEGAQTAEAKQNIEKSKYEMGKEQQTAKANAISQIMEEVESGKYGDGSALLPRWQRIARANPHIGLTDEDIQSAISGTHPLGAKYDVIKGENGRPEGLVDRTGKKYGPNQIPDDPEAQTAWNSAVAGHQQARSEKLKDEKDVAGFAADRQAQGYVNAQQTEARKQLEPRVNTALDADERLSRMERAYQKGVKGDQQAMLSLLTDHIGMTLGMQKGARITKDILNEAQNSQPWLAKIGAKFNSSGLLSGAALGPEQMKQMLDLGYEARDRAYGSARDASTTYGVALPPGFEKVEGKRQPGTKPALDTQSQSGPPKGATHTGVSSVDGKKYYLDAQGKKLGPAE